MKKLFPTFIEEAAQLEAHVSVSAGKRGLQILLSPIDLANVTQAHWSDLISI
jgi:Cys-tRNA(Pro)/Cys-tRNA(Cys) deacylase